MDALPSGDNLLFRLQAREIQTPRPGTAIRRCRELYEYVVPNHTVYDVEGPDHSIRKFTNDGQYLICFGRAQQVRVSP
jgi:de-etiolated-1